LLATIQVLKPPATPEKVFAGFIFVMHKDIQQVASK
jgi:hypothetical protein